MAATSPYSDDPLTLAEAMELPDADEWKHAAQAEYDSLLKAGTYTLTVLPPGRRAIGCKWVLTKKRRADGSVDRYKARLVAQGYLQKKGIDYNETFAPVVKFASLRLLLAYAAYKDLEIHQMDVKTAYLNGDIDAEIYMRQPEGFVVPGKEQLVCRLNKSLYGLKQAGRAWNQKMDSTLIRMRFNRAEADHCVYCLRDDEVEMYIALYVDDLLIFSNSLDSLATLKAQLTRQFDMKDLGEAQYVLGIQIERDRTRRILRIGQQEYIRRVINRFNMSDAKGRATPMEISNQLSKEDSPVTESDKDDMKTVPYGSAVGAIMYAMVGTRPDIAFAVTALSQFCSNPGRKHWQAVKHLLQYLKQTSHFTITYGATGSTFPTNSGDSGTGFRVFGYCDSDWGSNADDRRSITGYIFLAAGGAISWQAKKQPTVALSTVEAEYMAATQATKEALWFRSLLTQIGLKPTTATTIMSDSQGAIDLTKNPEYHGRTKHIDIQHHFIRQHVASSNVVLSFIGTDQMAADVLTKALTKEKHNRAVSMLGIASA